MAKENVETPYSLSWSKFKKYPTYKRIVKQLEDKGFNQPYINIIIRTVFDAGYNSK